MRVLATLLPLLAVVTAAHSSPHRHRRHARAVEQPNANIARSNEAHAQAVRVIRRQVRQRGQTCRPRNPANAVAAAAIPSSSISSSSSASSSATWTSSTTDAWAAPSYSIEAAPVPATSEAPSAPPAPPAPSPPAPSPPAPATQPDQGGQWGHNDGRCGWSNASPDAPNGSEDWLNCGVTSGGWTPPFLALGDVKAAPLTADGIFAPCAPYFWAFEQYGGEFGSEYIFSPPLLPLLMSSSTHHARIICHAGVNV